MLRYARLASLGLAVLSLATLVLASLFARDARADGTPGGAPIFVLDVQSLQADGSADDQAKALTTAIRSRVRASPSWQLEDADHSFETFRLTLKCPIGQEPDAACLQRIADHIQEGKEKADRYMWGEMKRTAPTEVQATMHLWQRNKPEVVATETYSDNLKDENDEALRTIAERIVATLTGGKQTGTITLHAGNGAGVTGVTGSVFVDGNPQGALDATGTAKIEVPTGSHLVEVRAQGYVPSSQNVSITAGAEQDLTFTLTPATATPPPPESTSSSYVPVRKIIGWSAIGLGVVSLGVGIAEGASFLSLKSDLDNERNSVPASVTNVCNDQFDNAAVTACSKYNSASSARTLEYVFVGLGAALVAGGVIVLVTDPGKPEMATKTGWRLLPHVGRSAGGLDLDVTF